MSKFLQTLKQVFKVGWQDAFRYAVWSLGGGLLGCVIVLIVMAVASRRGEPLEYFQLGGIMSLIVSVALFFFGNVFTIPSEFNLAISLGKTRKCFVPAKYLLLVFDLLVMLAAVIAVALLENRLYRTVYPGAKSAFSMEHILLRPEVIVSAAFGFSMLVLFFGALVMRFTVKVYWVIWALWMFGTLGSSRLVSAVSKIPEDSVWAQLARSMRYFFTEGISAAQATAMVLLLSVLGVAASMALLRRQRVTG